MKASNCDLLLVCCSLRICHKKDEIFSLFEHLNIYITAIQKDYMSKHNHIILLYFTI